MNSDELMNYCTARYKKVAVQKVMMLFFGMLLMIGLTAYVTAQFPQYFLIWMCMGMPVHNIFYVRAFMSMSQEQRELAATMMKIEQNNGSNGTGGVNCDRA